MSECIVFREKIQPAASHNDRPLRVNSLHYRSATLGTGSPQSADIAMRIIGPGSKFHEQAILVRTSQRASASETILPLAVVVIRPAFKLQ